MNKEHEVIILKERIRRLIDEEETNTEHFVNTTEILIDLLDEFLEE